MVFEKQWERHDIHSFIHSSLQKFISQPVVPQCVFREGKRPLSGKSTLWSFVGTHCNRIQCQAPTDTQPQGNNRLQINMSNHSYKSQTFDHFVGPIWKVHVYLINRYKSTIVQYVTVPLKLNKNWDGKCHSGSCIFTSSCPSSCMSCGCFLAPALWKWVREHVSFLPRALWRGFSGPVVL